ncbi:MAG: AAA family ATPase [Candidatus Bruticola sp.]
MNTDSSGQLVIASDNIEELMCVFPSAWCEGYTSLGRSADDLIEFVADLGRLPMARFQNEICTISDHPVSYSDLDYIASYVSSFGSDNRAGIDATLHRISAIRNRQGRIVGLTARVGRAVYGDADIIKDVVKSGRSILLLGQPGVGKTTVLREISRVLADELHKRVVIVDTSNEIAGDGDIPHPGVGAARRMQVADPVDQHKIMIEAVENHTPQVVVIDEIGTEAETYAARTIAERGVMLVATAHGTKLENLIQNPTLCDLVGGIESVTLSDEIAFKRGGGHKAILERKAPPTFDVVIELRDRHTFAVHKNVADSVDAILRGAEIAPLVRTRGNSVAEGHKGIEAAGSGAKKAKKSKTSEKTRPISSLAETESLVDNAVTESDKLKSTSVLAKYGSLIPKQSGLSSQKRENTAEVNLVGNLNERFAYLRRDRYKDDEGNILLAQKEERRPCVGTESKVSICPIGVSRNRLEKLIGLLELPAQVVSSWKTASVVLALESSQESDPHLFQAIKRAGLKVCRLAENTWPKIKAFLDSYFEDTILSSAELAQLEVMEAIEEVQKTGRPYNLLPQERSLRRMQGQLAAEAGIQSILYGTEPECYLRLQMQKVQAV